MDRRIAALNTVKKCENFASNALDRGRPDLAAEARLRSLEIRAEAQGAQSEAEREAL